MQKEIDREVQLSRCTSVEEILAGIWVEVLGLERVGVQDNFFELGGGSLLATQVISRVREAFQVELPLRAFFEMPTVSGLAESIATTHWAGQSPKILPLLPVSRDKDLPLSFAQERLWLLEQLMPGAYNGYSATRLTGKLNIMALEQSLSEITRRHESLRTNYKVVNGQPIQVINPPKPFPLSVVDLQKLPENERETEVLRIIVEDSQHPFELDRDLLLRCTLLRLDAEDYVFLLTRHHTLFDRWSMGVFFHELTGLYEAFSNGKPSPLPELPIQYADYAYWQRQHLVRETQKTHLPYWRQQLSGSLPVLQLPTDHPRLATQTFRGARQSLVLPHSLSDELNALSRQEGVTLFMLLLAAFQTLLHRYTGQYDIIVGSPTANRNRVELEGLIGYLGNTLILRTDLSGNPSFRELLGRVRGITLETYTHQDLPFEIIVKELKPEHDLCHNWPFQVMFALQQAYSYMLKLPGLTARHMDFYDMPAKLDLILCTMETEQGLVLTFEYNADLLNYKTITRMLGHFESLLAGIVVNPNECISTLPFLGEAEQQQLLVEWNNTQVDYTKDLCLHQHFEAQVERIPDSIAVIFEDQQLTYQELNRRANQLAHCLQALGVGPETFVGLCVERSLEMAVGMLGILKAGGAYVPLDPALPKERRAFMLKDTKVMVLLTQSRFLEDLPKHRAHIVCLDTGWEAIAAESEENVGGEVKSDHAAFVSYTSGSTGKPKGVVISHEGLSSGLLPETATYRLSQADGCLVTASNAMGCFWPWLGGARVIIARDAGYKDSAYLVKLIADKQVTFASFVPSMLRVFLEEEDLNSCACLRHVTSFGEPLSVELQERFFDRLAAELQNKYGQTEAGTITWVCKREDNRQFVPIGRPTANTQVYLLDSYLQPVPIGVSGEIYISSADMVWGYLNRPDLTAEKFIPNPFSDEPGARLYRTGDLGRYLSGGNIEFLGRNDYRIKIRGFRIELGEIEVVLAQHPAIREAVVIARENIPGDKRLVAYIVLHQEGALTISELRRFLKQKLPDHMVPSAFVMLDALPLTPNGKVDRRALPVPDQVRQEPEETFVAPRDELELQLTTIWESILDIHPIGVKDNFFDLGGHSLLAVRLFAQLEKITGRKLPLATLFQAPTVEQIADVLRQEGWSTPWSSLVAIQPGGSKPPFFCVPGNLGNVFTDLDDLASHLGPDQPFYGLQDGIQNPAQVEALAAHYLDEIRAVQPEGPYLLGGVCSGGVVAFEMAQQLQAQGQQVALLALVETPYLQFSRLYSYISFVASIFRRVVRRFGHHSRNVSQLGSAEQGAYIRLKTKLIANEWALGRYAPQPYPGQIHIFMADESLRSPHNLCSSWRELATGGAEVHVVPGTHDTITRTYDAIPEGPHLQVLAEQLRACIDEALTDDYRS